MKISQHSRHEQMRKGDLKKKKIKKVLTREVAENNLFYFTISNLLCYYLGDVTRQRSNNDMIT